MRDFAAPRAGVGEDIRFDVDDDFVAVRCKGRRIARFEHPLGHPRSASARRTVRDGPRMNVPRGTSVGDAWASGSLERRPPPESGGRWLHRKGMYRVETSPLDVLRRHALVVPPPRRLLRCMRGHRRIERAQDACAHFRREPPVQHHGGVVLVPEGQASVLVLDVGPLGLLGAFGSAMKTDELLHVLRSAVQADVKRSASFFGVAMRVRARTLE